MHHTVHGSLFSGCSGCLLRTCRVVHPYIHALYEPLGEGNVVARHEDNLADEPLVLGNLHDSADEVLAGLVSRVSLSCEEELNRHIRVVHNLAEPVKVGEEEGCPLVCGEPSCETDCENVIAESLLDCHDLARRVVVGDRRVGELLLDHVDKGGLEFLPGIPDFLVVYLVDTLEASLVIVVCLELRAEHLCVNRLPLLGSPGRVVNSVGHVADVKFLREIARVHRREDILADLAVEH